MMCSRFLYLLVLALGIISANEVHALMPCQRGLVRAVMMANVAEAKSTRAAFAASAGIAGSISSFCAPRIASAATYRFGPSAVLSSSWTQPTNMVATTGFGARLPSFIARASSSLPPLCWDGGMAVACVILAALWVGIWSTAVKKWGLPGRVSRKMVHCGSAPLFLLTWPFFSAAPSARIIAAMVPLLQAVRLTSAAWGDATAIEGKIPSSPSAFISAVSRSGQAKEATGGPLMYTLVLTAATALEWRHSLVGVIAMCQMAAGDGFAELVGRRLQGSRWWFSKEKTYAGSAGFVLGATFTTLAMVQWLHFCGCVAISAATIWPQVLLISTLAALAEVIPLEVDDNISVPAVAAALTRFLFGRV